MNPAYGILRRKPGQPAGRESAFSYALGLAGRPGDQLDVDVLDGEPPELAPLQVRLDKFRQFVVEDVAEPVVLLVIQVHVAEVVDVEIHLVVAAEAAAVDLEVRQLRQDVVDRGHRDFHDAPAGDFFRDHVGRGMAEGHHGLVHLQPLAGRLEAVALEPGTEFVQGRHRGIRLGGHEVQR